MGRWKPEEDTKLIEAVKTHSNNWVAVATLVSGRTDQQCRKRWLDTVDPVTVVKTPRRWKPEEDAKLTEAETKHGNEWVAVAAMVLGGRTNTMCRQRWIQALDPANENNKGKWKLEEEVKLIEAVKEHGNDWVAVAAMVLSRTNR
jgi:hypothetical protein